MSVYVHRYIEINRKTLEGRVDFSNSSKDLKPGCYYSDYLTSGKGKIPRIDSELWY